VFLFVSSLLVFWSLRGCSRVWLLLDLKVTLPCCCLCVLSIPSLSLLQPLAKCPSIVSWEISLLTAVLPLLVGGTTAPRYYRPPARYYRSYEGGCYTEGVRGSSPIPIQFLLPFSSQQQGSLAAPSPECRIRAVLRSSPPVGSIPTLFVCHGSRYCLVPPSFWLNFLESCG